ncbi:MAG: MFS transporter, partial [Chloroflexi bacterium]|nr:MFS transporter [Chloroflexota bacterium]
SFLRQTFSALKYRNYRLWFSGQTVSLFGTWMQRSAQAYLIFDLTKSPIYLGYVGFAYGVPSWLFMLYGGALADRFPRRTILLIAQITMMILAFVLAGLTFTGLVQPWHIIILAFLLGCANAFDAPARQAFVTELVDRSNLTNAIALNSSMINIATVVGPAVAGLTYAAFGPAWCFAINGLTFIAVIIALLLMKLAPFKPVDRGVSILKEIREGLSFVARNPTIRTIIINLGILSLAGLGFVTLLPVWAVDVLGGDATTNGYLHTARGLGALSGALLIAAIGQNYSKGKLFTVATFVMPVFLLLFSFTRILPTSFITLLGAGWGFMVIINLSNTLVQTNVTDELRGRVMGIFTFTFFGLMPIGSLINGAIADQIGTPLTVQINALILLAAAIILLLVYPFIRAQE